MAKTKQKKTCAKKCATPAKKVKYAYWFGTKTDGDAKMRNLLGGKGANLAEMARIGLPVPPGFTLTTEVCTYFYQNGRKYPATLAAEVKAGLESVEKQMGKKFSIKDGSPQDIAQWARDGVNFVYDKVLVGLNTVKRPVVIASISGASGSGIRSEGRIEPAP